jgi:hypothetical protein
MVTSCFISFTWRGMYLFRCCWSPYPRGVHLAVERVLSLPVRCRIHPLSVLNYHCADARSNVGGPSMWTLVPMYDEPLERFSHRGVGSVTLYMWAGERERALVSSRRVLPASR